MSRIHTTFLAALLSLAPLPAAAATRAATVPGGVRMQGDVVQPRSFTLASLPQLTPIEALEAQTHLVGGGGEEADRALRRLKEHPVGRKPDARSKLTLDRNTLPGGFLARPDLEPYAPTVNNGFEGISQAGWIPGEPTVAAGPLNVFTAGNVSITVTNKDGTNRIEIAGTTFFGVTPGEGPISDAQCTYDPLRARFVAIAFTQGTSPNHSNFYLAISKANDARGAWWLYEFDMTKDGTTQTTNWADYESLGFSGDKLAMTGQMYTLGGNSYQYPKIRVIDRAAAYAGQPVTPVDFVKFDPPAGGDWYDTFVTKAARTLTAGDNTIHLLNVRTLGGLNVTYRAITGSPIAPTLSAGVIVPVTSYAPPANAVQKGTTTLVPTNDCRTSDFYVRDGVLTVAWHESILLDRLVSAVRLFQLRTSDQTVLTDETYGAPGTDMYFPAATTDSVGTVFLGFDRSSANEYPSAYVTGRRRADTSLQPSALLKSGVAPNLTTRWGDFTGMDDDPALSGPGGAVAWYAGQYTRGTGTFGTWINRLTFSYGQIAGAVVDDCDGATGTPADRSPLAGVTVTLMQGATTVATTTTGATGAWSFGYLESGTYDVVVTPPAGGASVDAIAGGGGTTQTRVSAADVQVALATTQSSTANQFVVTSPHASPVAYGLAPFGRVAGSGAFTLTVNGDAFVRCSVVRWDGADRPTTWVSATQLTASISGPDVAAAGAHVVTVFSGAPGGGASNAETFTVGAGADTQAPVVTLTSPVGGESWTVGSVHTITWNATDDMGVVATDLAWSRDGGATFRDTVATGVANSGHFDWTVPGVPGANVRVRAIAHDGGGNVGADSSHASFTIAGWTITASAGANGVIGPVGTLGVADGATPSYSILAAAGYRVLDVQVDGVSVGAVTGYTFPPVHASHMIAVSFAVAQYALTINLSGSGSIARVPDQAAYTSGTSVTLTATAQPGWAFDGWSGDMTATVNPLGVTMDASKTLTATFTQHVYAWNGTGGADWDSPTSWTPTRSTPASDDLMQFSTGDSVVITNLSTQTIGRLSLANGSRLTLQPLAAITLTLSGRAGTDFDVPAGCSLTLNGTSAVTIALGSGATGAVGGTINVANAAHRLTGATPGSLVFLGGSRLLIGNPFGGSVFGNGNFTSTANSVVFQAGSLLAQAGGANPFGFSVPGTAVIFQAGSRYRIDGNLILSVSGRTYADVEMNYPGTLTATGNTPFSMDSLVVTQGTLNLNLTGGGTIRGGIRVQPGAALGISPASGTPVYTLGGATPQSVSLAGAYSSTSNATLGVNNPAGVTLLTDWTLAGPLAFTTGRVTTGAHTLGIAAGGGVSGAGPASGWVSGRLRRNFATGASTRTFDVGDAGAYTPITVAMNGAASAFDVSGGTATPDHPQLASSDLDAARTANRWWTLAATAPPAFSSCDATFTFVPADLDASANPANFVVRRYAGGWTAPATGARTATSTQATGIPALGDFALGEHFVDTTAPTVAVTAPNGGEALSVGTSANLTWTATDDVGVTSVDLLLSRAGPGGPFDTLAAGIPNTGTYGWTVTSPATSDAWLQVRAHDFAGNVGSDLSDAAFTIAVTAGVETGGVKAFALAPVAPNPLCAGGRFGFALPHAAAVHLAVLDVQGREVCVLAVGEYAAGLHEVTWTASGASLRPGLYFARLRVAGRTFTRRFVLAY